MINPRLTDRAQREMEENFDNQMEAFRLLGLIDAEFQTDPTSTQCFDLRIVQRVRECMAKRTRFVERNPLYRE